MKIRWQYGLAFPLILAVALGGLSAWLGRISEIQTEEVQLNPDEPQYWMGGMEGKRFDEQGNLQEHFTATQAFQLPNSKDVHFRSPKLNVHQQGKLAYQVEGKEGLYNTDTRIAVFQKEVLLTKPADGTHPAGTVKTEFIHVDTQAQFAQTEHPVEFAYGQSHGSSVGMTYDHTKGLLNFPSKVKATIYDAKNL